MTDNNKTKQKASGLESPVQQGFHLMAKPAGPSCNLRCSYCFYREKKTFFPETRDFHMSDAVLEAYINISNPSSGHPSNSTGRVENQHCWESVFSNGHWIFKRNTIRENIF
jgi:sulfatase maturation enzyme AslB (radical SAM superfamily)